MMWAETQVERQLAFYSQLSYDLKKQPTVNFKTAKDRSTDNDIRDMTWVAVVEVAMWKVCAPELYTFYLGSQRLYVYSIRPTL